MTREPGRWSTTIGPLVVVVVALGAIGLAAFGPGGGRVQPLSFLPTLLLPTLYAGSITFGHPISPPRRIEPWVLFLFLFGIAAGWTARIATGDGRPGVVLVCGLVAAALTVPLWRQVVRTRERRAASAAEVDADR